MEPHWDDITDTSAVDENRHADDRVYRLDSHVLPGGGIVDVSFGWRLIPVDGKRVEQFGVTSIRVFAKFLGPVEEDFAPLVSMELLQSIGTLPLAELVSRSVLRIQNQETVRAKLQADDPGVARFLRQLNLLKFRRLDVADEGPKLPDTFYSDIRDLVALGGELGLPDPISHIAETFQVERSEISNWLRRASAN